MLSGFQTHAQMRKQHVSKCLCILACACDRPVYLSMCLWQVCAQGTALKMPCSRFHDLLKVKFTESGSNFFPPCFPLFGSPLWNCLLQRIKRVLMGKSLQAFSFEKNPSKKQIKRFHPGSINITTGFSLQVSLSPKKPRSECALLYFFVFPPLAFAHSLAFSLTSSVLRLQVLPQFPVSLSVG